MPGEGLGPFWGISARSPYARRGDLVPFGAFLPEAPRLEGRSGVKEQADGYGGWRDAGIGPTGILKAVNLREASTKDLCKLYIVRRGAPPLTLR